MIIVFIIGEGEGPANMTLIGKIRSYIFADTQEPNEEDDDVDFQIVERVLVGGELCDPYAGDDQTTYVKLIKKLNNN